ncbi:hypothetical protein AJ80_09645 [Polytolypa hystricis UAMH7299]|uniref:HEAT repeat protein n=1 Tax=Polytolypa hystricis (strain UAMH7299) TaxID=1447883 RepID=A0A2B7WMC9_POLH7|nr:hypothetical protein AJ80_09645 [Polytolypa hystricis UAMH7299]
MDDSRQQAFLKLRSPCVELSSIGLKFRANLASSRDVLRALETVHGVLNEVASRNSLDEKLAEYAFFPLSHIFNETQRVSARCLEVAVQSLQVLIEKGWRRNISPDLGKQLLILLTLMAGGTPGQSQNQTKPQSEELAIAAFDCIGALCDVLQGRAAFTAIFNEIGTTTIVDQTIYVLLEGITDGSSDEGQLAAANALQVLNSRITNRVVLASLMPRTVSALTKALKPTTQVRRSYKVLCRCLSILREILCAVLNDAVVDAAKESANQTGKAKPANTVVLDDSWLKATTSQVKLALANVIRLRGHDRHDVRHALLELCLMVIEECIQSLADCLSLMVETVVVLSDLDEQGNANEAYLALKHLATSAPLVVDLLKSSMHTWIIALPRVMQSDDDTAKQRAIKQISTAFQVLSQTQPSFEILDDSLASSLGDSVSAAIKSSSNAPQPLPDTSPSGLEVGILQGQEEATSFRPVLMEHHSQRKTLSELQSMIKRLNSTDTSLTMTRSILKRLYSASGDSFLASFWLTLSFLKGTPSEFAELDDMLDIEYPSDSRAGLVEELYSISLPLLTDMATANPPDWRISALALEGVALQAQQLGKDFRPELIDALYPILQLMGSNNPNLQQHAMTCLNILTSACKYPDASTLLIDNVDYLVNSVALKLNTFDISPQAPQVLLMMVRLCGASLIPYLDDLVGSIFAVLDAFHGYPKLVELLFSVLGTVVDEGAKKPTALAITESGGESPLNYRKQPYTSRSISDIANMFKERKELRARATEMETGQNTTDGLSHPMRPWTSTLDGPGPAPETEPIDEDANEFEPEADEEPLPEPTEEEKPLSKSHNLLLNIVKSIPPHLSSPSPFLRRSLLSILARALPILALNENTFLPLINDLWPSVSARITMPPTLPSPDSIATTLTTRSTTTTTSPPQPPTTAGIDETGIREETFVITACCTAIATMCEGSGDFMSSRIEHEFPRWKKLYVRCWERVRVDSLRAAERHRQRLQLQQQQQQQQQQRLDSSQRAVSSDMQALTLNSTRSDDAAKSPLIALSDTTSTTSTHPAAAPPQPPPPFPNSSKIFTPHHALWKSLLILFTSILTHVRLPADISDEICELVGDSIAFYVQEYYFTGEWREGKQPKQQQQASQGIEQGDNDLIIQALRAMEIWNADLAWFIFSRARARYYHTPAQQQVIVDDKYTVQRSKMDELLSKFRASTSSSSSSSLGTETGTGAGWDSLASDGGGRWNFAQVVFF